MSPDLPEVLAAPPWRDRKRKRAKPIVVEGLVVAQEPSMRWQPGERESWLTGHGAGWVPEDGWESAWRPDALDEGSDSLPTYIAAYAPDELVRPRLADWTPPLQQADNRARTYVAKYELAALPAVLAMARRPAERAQLLQPFVSAEIAGIMVDGLARLRSMRGHAVAWLRRHSDVAVPCLVPTMLGKPGKARQNTVAALRILEADGVDVAAIVGAAYGEDVAAAAKAVLADRGLDVYPRTVPQAPPWADVALLPPIRLADGETALPEAAARAVVEMLMFSKPDAPYPGLDSVKEACDASSLAEFAWSLCTAWKQAGAWTTELWAFRALGILGDEMTVARLQLLTSAWYASSRYDHVFEAFAVLAAIGGDRSLAALHIFANRAWIPRAKRRAQAAFDDVAQARDLTADQLADRLVPGFGLEENEAIALDYGRRRFAVTFDELLRPRITDQDGATFKTLPKPGKRDDAELAESAYQRFSAIRKDVNDLTMRQTLRLEKAMTGRRRWTPQELTAHLVRHPLLGHIVRRLVWGVYAPDGAWLGAFRVAEDLSFADVEDAPYEVPEGGLIGVAHPVDLGQTLARWSEVFADYEILQPFEQLGRPPLALTDEERGGKRLLRSYIYPDAQSGVVGRVERFSPTRVERLASQGWQRGPVGARRLWSRLLRPVGGGRFVILELEPGLAGGSVTQSEYQAVTAVWLSGTGDDPEFDRHALPLSELDDVSASVILRDLEELANW